MHEPPIAPEALIAAVDTLFDARERQLTSLAHSSSLPPYRNRQDIERTLRVVKHEHAAWKKSHAGAD
jgi:hypothetical protein